MAQNNKNSANEPVSKELLPFQPDGSAQLQRDALYRDLCDNAAQLTQAYPGQFRALENTLKALAALRVTEGKDASGYREVSIDSNRDVPDYVQRLEQVIVSTGVSLMMHDWARVRFDLMELARQQKIIEELHA